MSDAASYAREKLFQAVDALVTGSGRVHERLGAAAIQLLPARPGDIPCDDLRRTFVGVIGDLSYANLLKEIRELQERASAKLGRGRANSSAHWRVATGWPPFTKTVRLPWPAVL